MTAIFAVVLQVLGRPTCTVYGDPRPWGGCHLPRSECVTVASQPIEPYLSPMTEITARFSTALADRYKIERHLGEGGMATVYLAEDLKHKRKVAVKESIRRRD